MLTLIRCPFHLLLLQWHVKDPGHSVRTAGGWFHLNTHTPLTQGSQNGLIMPLSRHSVGTYPETSSHATCQGTFGQLSQLAEPLWTDPCIKSGISVCELTSTLKKKNRTRPVYRSKAGQLVGYSAGLVIERLRVRIPAGAAGEFSSPELTLCADSYSVSVPPPCYRSGT